MQLPELSIRRPVLATVMSLIILLIGMISYDRLAVRLIPNVDEPIVTVATYYPGANAQVIESQVTKPIEDALSGIEGIDFISSVSRAEGSQVTVRFKLDRDPDAAASDVRDRVSQARGSLPEEVNEPIVQKQDLDSSPIMTVAVSGPRSPRDLFVVADRFVKNVIESSRGVGQVTIVGAADRAVQVSIDARRLAAHRLSILEVREALVRQNVEIPGGRMDEGQRERG